MSFLRAAFEAAGAARAAFGDSNNLIPPRQSHSTWSGVDVTDDAALRLLAVWACVSLISDAIAMLPADAFRGEGPNRQPVSKPRILEEPYAGVGWLDWIHMGLVSCLMRGNHYGRIVERDALMFPTQIQPLHPAIVQPFRDRRDGRIYYRVAGETLDANEIFHVRGMTWPGMFEGLSPIGYARQAIGLGLAAQEFGARFFGDGATPSGMLKTAKRLTKDEAEAYQQMWLEAHGSRQRKPAVLGGDLEFQTISLKPEEAQFLETRKLSRSEIAGFYRVPPHLISDVEPTTSWGSGIEEQGLAFVTFTLGIWLSRYEAAISRILPRPRYMKFNVSALLRGRLLDQLQAFKLAREIGIYSVDEERALLDLPPLPDGKGADHTQPLNWGALPSGPAAPGSSSPTVTGPAK